MSDKPLIIDVDRAGAALCRKPGGLAFFVKEFWSTIVPNELKWMPHMDVLCDEIQRADERVFKRLPREKDLIINVPPGTSKTKIVSVLSTAWEFARMPEIKVYVGSYSDDAVSGIADEIRLVMRSDKYRRWFPEVLIRKEKDSLHNFKTETNGEFYAFTVGGTLTSKHADILKCLPYEELIMTSEGPKKIGDIVENKMNVEVLSYNHATNQKEFKPIIKYEKNAFRRLVEIETNGGKKFRCTEDHLVYVQGKGYIKAIELTANDIIITD